MNEVKEGNDVVTPIVTETLGQVWGFLARHSNLVWVPIVVLLLAFWAKPQLERWLDERRRRQRGGGWKPLPDTPLQQQDERLAAARQRLLQKVEGTTEERQGVIQQQEVKRHQEQLRLLKEREALNKEKLRKSAAGASGLGPASAPSSYRPSFSMRNQRRGGCQ